MSTFESRTTSAWPVFISLLAAGWIGSFGATFVTNVFRPLGFGGFLLFAVVGDVIAARFLPSILRAIAGLDVSFGNALVALIAGTLTTAVLINALRGFAVPGLAFSPAIGIFGLAPGLAGTVVSYFVLEGVAAPPSPAWRSPSRRALTEDVAVPEGVDYASTLAKARSAVTDTCNLRAYCSPDDWPLRSLDALNELQLAADRLRRTDPQNEAKRAAHDELIEALRDLQDDVVQMGRYDVRDPSSILRAPAIDPAERAINVLGA